MTVRVACQGDSITAGVQYVITRAGQNTVRINNKLVAVADPGGAAQVTNHPNGRGGHTNIKIASGSSTIFIGGKPLARAGDALTCGTHTISGTVGTILSTTVYSA